MACWIAVDIEQYRESINGGPWVERRKRTVHYWVADRMQEWRRRARRR